MAGVVAVADMLTTRSSLPGRDNMSQRYDVLGVPLLHRGTARGRVSATPEPLYDPLGDTAVMHRISVLARCLSDAASSIPVFPSSPVYPVIPISPGLPITPSSPISPVVPTQECSTYVLDVEPPSLPASVAGTLAGSTTAAPTSPVEPSLLAGGLPVLNEVLAPADRCPATLRGCTDNGDCIHI